MSEGGRNNWIWVALCALTCNLSVQLLGNCLHFHIDSPLRDGASLADKQGRAALQDHGQQILQKVCQCQSLQAFDLHHIPHQAPEEFGRTQWLASYKALPKSNLLQDFSVLLWCLFLSRRRMTAI